MASKSKQGKCTKKERDTIAFVLACLFSSAITKADLRQWAISIIDKLDAESTPSYIFDLVDFNGELKDIYKIIGFVPIWNCFHAEENSLYGISVIRGVGLYDAPLKPQEALLLLKENPHIFDSFVDVFPFIILPELY